MPSYPFFFDKLKKVQKLSNKINHKEHFFQNNLCSRCTATKYYQLGNIVWGNNIKHKIKSHTSYPSEYFVKIIMGMCIIDDTIVNPPITLKENQIRNFNYVRLSRNHLLIIDALMKQGSQPRYLVPKDRINKEEKYVYSEHSGVISIKDNMIDNIIVSTETNRLDMDDDNIYLPINTKIMSESIFFFHTHPNTNKNGGRIDDGIIYEFPSANDIFNFIKYSIDGKAQASVIVAAEGTYVIRMISYQNEVIPDKKFFYLLKRFILKIEKLAMKKIRPQEIDYDDPNVFHEIIGNNLSFVRQLNRFVEPMNVFIEYYPRSKINNEWVLDEIYLAYVSHKNFD